MHMVQHLVLMLVAAPLIVLSRPSTAMLFALPNRWRAPVGRLGNGAVGAVWRCLTSPIGSWGLYLVTLWVWHVPSLYQRAIVSDPVHFAQHASFLFSAVCLWTAVADRPRRTGHHGAAFLSMFATAVHSCALGALLALSAGVWYPFYAERAGLGVSALHDQQVGGLVMWVPSALVLAGTGLIVFSAWLTLAGRRAERHSALRRNAGGLAVVMLLALVGCSPAEEQSAARALIHTHGCGTCHVIPGIPGADGRSGPPLTNMARQAYVAGVIPNRRDELVRFIVDPQAVDPRSAMPDLGITAYEAGVLADYLYRHGQ